jgi:membrane protease YdiL (CAAX protease family)
MSSNPRLLALLFLPAMLLGLLLGVALAALLVPKEVLLGEAPFDAGTAMAMALLGLLPTVLVLLVLARFLDVTPAALRLNEVQPLRRWLQGVAAGLLLPLPILAIAGSLSALSIHALKPSPTWLQFVMALGVAALAEELIFRSYLLTALERWWGPDTAALGSSLAFAALHLSNPGILGLREATLAFAGVMLAGLALARWTQRSGSIFAAWGLHWSWNLGLGCIWGLPVSGLEDMPTLLSTRLEGSELLFGGAFGPESGLLWQAGWLALLLALLRRSGHATSSPSGTPSP